MLKLDPGAARRRREEAEKAARVECWTDSEGTATLAGKSLPPAQVLAADKRLCQVAAWWKKQIRAAWRAADPHGQMTRPEHGTDLLRARAYLALLLGQPLDTPPADLLPPAPAATPGDTGTPDGTGTPGTPGSTGGTGSTGPDSPRGDASPAGGRAAPSAAPGTRTDHPASPGSTAPRGTGTGDGPPVPYRGDPAAALPPLTGSIAVTLPLATLLGWSDNPGEITGYGPLPGDITRRLARAAARHPATDWTLIITDPHGHAIGHGYAPRAKPIRGHPADGWTITLTTQRIASGHSP